MERSTALNKILKPSSCKPLGESVPRDMALKLFFPILFLFLIAGCGALQTSTISWEADRPADCQALLEKLDAAVIKTGVRDAAEAPVAGFPYLRANRFAASLAGTLPDAVAKNAWVQWMSDLDLAAREKEIRNLPAESVTALATSREDLLLRVRACSKDLYNYDRGRPEFVEILTPRVNVPGEYSSVLRIIGLYPLITLPEYKITDGVRERVRSWYETPCKELRVVGSLRTYRPPPGQGRDAREIITASKHNPLDIPMPSADEAREMAVSYAPVIFQDEAAPYDRVGRIAWKGMRVGRRRTETYGLLLSLPGPGERLGDPAGQLRLLVPGPCLRPGPRDRARTSGRHHPAPVLRCQRAAVIDRPHEQLRLLSRFHSSEGPGGAAEKAILRERSLRPAMAPGDCIRKIDSRSCHVGLASGSENPGRRAFGRGHSLRSAPL